MCMTDDGSNEADLELANLVYRSLGAVEVAGRFGPRKVFISALWGAMLRMDAAAIVRLAGGELAQVKRWLVGAQRLIRSESERTPLVVLARADFVAAMHGERQRPFHGPRPARRRRPTVSSTLAI